MSREDYKSDRHAALEASYPSKPKRIAPAPWRREPVFTPGFLPTVTALLVIFLILVS